MGIGKVAASLGGVLLVWWAATTFGQVNPVLVPGPALVWAAAVELWQDGTMGADLRVSLGRAGIGFGIGSVLGVLVGLLTARTRLIGAAVTPVLTLLRPIPAIALVPLAIVWFGIGEGSKWFVIAYTVFLAVWLLPVEVPLLAQVAAFVVLSFASIQVYRRWFRGRERDSDQPALNRRTAALVGRVVVLERAIADGRGRVQIADAYWEVAGPELPAGTRVRVVGGDAMTLQVEAAD